MRFLVGVYLAQKCFKQIVQQLNFFIAQATIANLATLQWQGMLMSWKAAEKDFFLVASTE
jgi:hypothetical protein